MLDLTSIKSIVSVLSWMLTLGKSEVKHVQAEIEDTITELSKSLVSLWDVTTFITDIPDANFNGRTFETKWDFFVRFYLEPPNIEMARTHCGNVERNINRITFKLGKALHTDLGKWSEATQTFICFIEVDQDLIDNYDKCIELLRQRLDAIRTDLSNDNSLDEVGRSYIGLKHELESDIQELRKGIRVMSDAANHIRRVAG